jgi:hypothetical protein
VAAGLGGGPLWLRLAKKLASEAVGLGILLFRGGSGVIAQWPKTQGILPDSTSLALEKNQNKSSLRGEA